MYEQLEGLLNGDIKRILTVKASDIKYIICERTKMLILCEPDI